MNTNWRELLIGELEGNKESWDDVIYTTLSEGQLSTNFDNGFGGEEGCPFTLWTRKRVYFPVCYDGSESVASVPRDPCDKVTYHIGGG